jgi:archaemetzincin
MTHEEGIRAVRIVRVGTLAPALAAELAAAVSARVAVPCRVAAAAAAIEPSPLQGRAQVDADRLLDGLERLPREPGTVTAGVTALDMGSPIFTHHFGRARHGGHALLVSLARLTPAFYGLPDDRGLMLRRAALELLHELGHVAGLGHCDDYGCIMRFAPTVEDIDNRGTTFCESCAGRVSLPGVAGFVPR